MNSKTIKNLITAIALSSVPLSAFSAENFLERGKEAISIYEEVNQKSSEENIAQLTQLKEELEGKIRPIVIAMAKVQETYHDHQLKELRNNHEAITRHYRETRVPEDIITVDIGLQDDPSKKVVMEKYVAQKLATQGRHWINTRKRLIGSATMAEMDGVAPDSGYLEFLNTQEEVLEKVGQCTNFQDMRDQGSDLRSYINQYNSLLKFGDTQNSYELATFDRNNVSGTLKFGHIKYAKRNISDLTPSIEELENDLAIITDYSTGLIPADKLMDAVTGKFTPASKVPADAKLMDVLEKHFHVFGGHASQKDKASMIKASSLSRMGNHLREIIDQAKKYQASNPSDLIRETGSEGDKAKAQELEAAIAKVSDEIKEAYKCITDEDYINSLREALIEPTTDASSDQSSQATGL